MTDVIARWPEILRSHPNLRDRLISSYQAPERGYHDLRHLSEVLDRIHEILAEEPLPDGPDTVVLAAWFHDAVYEGARDDEERSAELARLELRETVLADELVEEVVRLVLVTGTHRPGDDDPAGQILCDADLAILAAGPERYQEYVGGVRQEYAHLPEADFGAGRAAVLHDLLMKPSLFQTKHGIRHWQKAAVRNIKSELRQLER